ncbi:MAG: potassium-transporting ATPase subunit KdpA [Bdellovibrionia bacterium]
MKFKDYLELLVFLGIIFSTAKPLGLYMDAVLENGRHPLKRVLGPVERALYRFARIDPTEEQSWDKYVKQILAVSLVSLFVTYVILRYQNFLPLNPQKFLGLAPGLAWNTAISFTTNTNWQAYAGEGTLSYFSQMVGLTLHNFFSASVGISAAVALIRGIAAKGTGTLGNFWADFVRTQLYILLPACVVYALFLVSQGVVQNFSPYLELATLEGAKQTLAFGPVASQVAIKTLGTNGGGFFNANAAHPFENPTSASNFIQMISIFLIPSALVYLLGKKVNNLAHGWSVWVAMALLFTAGVGIVSHFEYQGNPQFTAVGCSSSQNFEGKEVRFGVFDSSLFATVTTAASCGAVNSAHDALTPMGGFLPLFNLVLGEVVFGGVGAGLYGMILFIVLTVFIAGLMVGRTPEYLGKKIEGREVKYAMIAMIVAALSTLILSAVGSVLPSALVSLGNNGPHGLSEILYAFASSTGNNGSAFGGLNANITFWNLTTGIAMFCGRFFMMIPLLAIGGSLSHKRIHATTTASFPVQGPIFTGLLIGVVVIVGALTFFPAICLGPVAEHFEMMLGKTF